jgi:hypothetical protein
MEVKLMNMSYCRFNNTRIDLLDCLSKLEEIIELENYDKEEIEEIEIEDSIYSISEEELEQCKFMLEEIAVFYENYMQYIDDKDDSSIYDKIDIFLDKIKNINQNLKK